MVKQKELIKKLIEVSNKLPKSKNDYIVLSEEYIQEQANERGISFDDMVELIKKTL